MNQSLYRTLASEIEPHQIITKLKTMLAIRSENPFDSEPKEGFREKEMAEFLEAEMSAMGLETTLVHVAKGRPNVFGVLRGSGEKESLMLAGHMDTAPTRGWPEAYDIRVENGNIHGRGACDMKAALAAYLAVADLIKEAGVKLKGDLIIAGICDEEHHMLGSKHVGAYGPQARCGIIGEPSNLEICPANRGQLGSVIRTYGKAVHSSVRERGVNAIVHMAHIIEAFNGYNLALKQKKAHPLLGFAGFNPGVIKGGSMLSTVPDYCELEIDRRFLPGETVESIYQEYHERIAPLCDSIEGFSYEISPPTLEVAANDVPEKEPVVQALMASVQHLTGRPAIPRAFVAGSDAPYLGFPTVICGPGSLSQAHSQNEYVPVDQLLDAVRIYLNATLTLLA